MLLNTSDQTVFWNGIPLLEDEINLYDTPVSKAMIEDPKVIMDVGWNVDKLRDFLILNRHNSFPIVDKRRKIVGVASRLSILKMLGIILPNNFLEKNQESGLNNCTFIDGQSTKNVIDFSSLVDLVHPLP